MPSGRGLGSSAALAVATLRALAAAAGRTLDPTLELDAGRRLEAVFHGTPSGIDPAAAALGTCFRFVRGEPPVVTPLPLPAPLPLVVAFGSRPRRTAAAVGGLRERWQADRARHEALFDEVAAVVERGARAATSGDLPALGRAFDDNQALLERLGVSSDEIATLVGAARRAGALGAKLTGGGAGGAVIALADDPESLALRLRDEGWTVLVSRIETQEG
jgi:mevalonate kinase